MSYRPSVRTHYKQGQFAEASVPKVQRSKFDRSHSLKTTFNSGLLIPIYVDEALPGDTFSLRMQTFTRMPTLIDPVMDNIWVDFFFFSVPNRLLWDNWRYFMGEDPPAGAPTEYTPPTVFMDGSGPADQLYDYLGIPPGTDQVSISAFPSRAYQFIYNEWFRDQNLGSAYIKHPTGDGPDGMAAFTLVRRNKRKDYFTGALPWPAKGADVEIGLGGTVPIVATGDLAPTFSGGGTTLPGTLRTDLTDDGVNFEVTHPVDDPLLWSDPKLEGDLSSATAVTVNELREALGIQHMLEIDARAGTRLTETIEAHFGVISEDSRQQRPEYLGGGRQHINVNPVVQMAPDQVDPDDKPLGSLAAYGTGSAEGIGFTKSFTEHSIVIGIACATAELTYWQGIHRMWSRQDKYDYYWPSLSNLGEQAILNKELVATGDLTGDELVFGYQERYSEYRYAQNRLAGQFRLNHATPLSTWSLAEDLTQALPVLDHTFIQELPPIDRIVATTDEPQFTMDAYFKLTCARPMPMYATPGLRRF